MKKLVTSKDFSEYFNKTDSVVAATIAQEKMEEFLKKLLSDPTLGAGGMYAEGYRDCLSALKYQVGMRE